MLVTLVKFIIVTDIVLMVINNPLVDMLQMDMLQVDMLIMSLLLLLFLLLLLLQRHPLVADKKVFKPDRIVDPFMVSKLVASPFLVGPILLDTIKLACLHSLQHCDPQHLFEQWLILGQLLPNFTDHGLAYIILHNSKLRQ